MFRKAIIQSFKTSVKWYLGSFGGAVATFFFFDKYIGLKPYVSVVCGVGIFTITFLVGIVLAYIKLYKVKVAEQRANIEMLNTAKRKEELLTQDDFYGEAISVLTKIFSKVHSLRKLDKIEKVQITEVMSSLCGELKKLFELRIKDNTYSVIIFLFGPMNQSENILDTEVTPSFYDESSFHKKRNAQTKHTIYSNTSFLEIFQNLLDPAGCYFFQNHLPVQILYKNSYSNIYGTVSREIESPEDRRKTWTLPFRSEIVVPLAPIEIPDTERKKQFLGYLAVNCNNEFAFHKKYDVNMLRGIADGIYDIIKLKN